MPRVCARRRPQPVLIVPPDSIHPTGGDKGQSHATGKSIVPQKLQEALPESIERAVPNKIHVRPALSHLTRAHCERRTRAVCHRRSDLAFPFARDVR